MYLIVVLHINGWIFSAAEVYPMPLICHTEMERQAAGVGKPVELAAAPAPIHIICSNNHL
jgi:hypothetical protein